MKKRFLCLLLLAITLTAVLGASTHVHKVAAASYPVIYIQADGAIHPATANITSSDNVTYTFTGDIYASLVVQRDHIVVDGAGYTVHGNGSGTGIDISYLNNVTLQNVEVTNFTDGIHVNSVYVAVVDNTVLNNTYGIHVESSHHVTVVGNTVLNNTDGIFLQNSNYVTAIGNTVSSNTGVGITLWGSLYNTLSGNTATNNDIGIGLSNSQFSTITGNTATNNSEVGIYLWGSSDSNTITGNTASNNAAGILLHDSANLVTGNTISSNSQYGIWIYASGDNVLFHNNLLGNAKAIEVSSASPNVFDNGLEGNYWSNYTGVDSNHDGLGDTPHVINANNTDYHPLMGAFHSFNTSVGSYVAVTSNSTIDSFQHFVSNTTIRMHVSNTTASQTLGFCRIRIPYEVMSEPFSVTVDGANPTYWDYTLDDNGTHRWIYFEYAHSTKEVVIVPEFPSAFILPLFIALSLLVTIAYRRKHAFKT
jgi:parallel beta-helix repeat protein